MLGLGVCFRGESDLKWSINRPFRVKREKKDCGALRLRFPARCRKSLVGGVPSCRFLD